MKTQLTNGQLMNSPYGSYLHLMACHKGCATQLLQKMFMATTLFDLDSFL